jgi:predicted chitinase
MDQELRDLVEQMRQLIPVLQGMNKPPGTSSNQPADKMSRGVDRMVVALGQLVVKLDATKKSRREEEEAVKKFANAVERTAKNLDNENKEREAATAALEKEIKSREEATRRSKLSQQGREQEDKERALKKAKDDVAQSNRDAKTKIEESRQSKSSSKELFESLSSTGGSAEILKNKFLDLGGDSLKAQSGLQLFSAGLSGTAKSLTTFATGLINGERGAQLSAKALGDFANPLLDAAKVISGVLAALSFIPGPIGFMSRGARIAGASLLGLGAAAGKAAVKFNEIGAKQLDTLVKSFNDASGAGVSLAGGLEGTLDLMHTLNMTTADAAQFQEMLSKNNKQLALLGGTAGTGAKRFAEVSGALVKSDIGQTFEIMGITQQEQREAALLYMSIQARTGQMQLKNTEKLIEESARFVHELDQAAQLTGATRREQQEAREAAMAEVRFRAALIDAQQRGDTADMAQLKVAERAAAIAKSLGDEKGFLGILQQAAGQGALTTPESIAAEQTYRISEILAQPNITDQQILAHLAKNADLNLQSLAGTNRLIGGIDVLQTNIVGMDNSVKRQTALAQEAAKSGFTGPDAITKYLAAEEKKRKQPGGDLGLMVGAGRAQQAAAMTMEAGIATFNYAADINEAASKTFADAVSKFGDIVGFKSPAGGVPTYTAPGSAKVPAGMDVANTNKRVESAKADLKSLDEKIKAQEEKLRLAKTDAEKQEAKTEIERLKGELNTANKRANAAEMEQIAARNRAKLAAAGAVKPVDTKLLDALTSSGITDRRAQANVLAQIQAESGGVPKSENLKYTPEQLLKTFPNKFRNIQEAREVAAGGEEAIGERVYGGRMGNLASGEGYKYRGRGLIQLTGKENYKKFSDILGIDLVGKPELANDPDIARRIAVAYFTDKQKSGVDLTQSGAVSKAVGHVDIGGVESSKRAAMADLIASKIPGAANGGVFRGPMSGYPAVLHGNEAVIPLKNGAVPVMLPALDELVSSNRAVDAQVQVLRNEMGSMMRELVNAIQTMKETGSQERMIQLLESMSRSQQSTATATQRMAQLASN